ncbi:MAG: DUF134 domain-containing protein [Phycisphaerae bacterium]|nr:DUF134 domain-containing protein [Phycisphaerae bacterium]
MARPQCCRRVSLKPAASMFKPCGIPLRHLEEIIITLDEFEALRLADFEGLYQEEAAERMGVSRPTFGRIIEAARKKVADSLINGKALKIEGGTVYQERLNKFKCSFCSHEWSPSAGEAPKCPRCSSRYENAPEQASIEDKSFTCKKQKHSKKRQQCQKSSKFMEEEK